MIKINTKENLQAKTINIIMKELNKKNLKTFLHIYKF